MTDQQLSLQQVESMPQEIQQQGLNGLQGVVDEATLQEWRVATLGRSAPIMGVMRDMPKYAPEARPQVGKLANQVKQALEAALEERQQVMKASALERTLNAERLDVTMPGRLPLQGRLHPTTQTLREIIRTLSEMGFQTYRSREVESDEYNFELLNIPAHHPARDMWDTFYGTNTGMVLRTHTSPGQIHAMHQYAPEPVRVLLPGMCFRYEQISARSEIQFNQVELIAVGYDISFGDMKGTLQDFARRMFGENVHTRLRPSYFPFTEPSAEMDVECFVCGGKGCPVCKGSGWLEILGCGMMHPTVLQNGGYDPRKFRGFAAGMGVERIAMLKHRIDDIRNFWANDVRFLEQF